MYSNCAHLLFRESRLMFTEKYNLKRYIVTILERGDRDRRPFTDEFNVQLEHSTMSSIIPFDIIAEIVDIVGKQRHKSPQGPCSSISLLPPNM